MYTWNPQYRYAISWIVLQSTYFSLRTIKVQEGIINGPYSQNCRVNLYNLLHTVLGENQCTLAFPLKTARNQWCQNMKEIYQSQQTLTALIFFFNAIVLGEKWCPWKGTQQRHSTSAFTTGRDTWLWCICLGKCNSVLFTVQNYSTILYRSCITKWF